MDLLVGTILAFQSFCFTLAKLKSVGWFFVFECKEEGTFMSTIDLSLVSSLNEILEKSLESVVVDSDPLKLPVRDCI